jgi:hypothetical protein
MRIRDYGDWTEIYTRRPRNVAYNEPLSVIIRGHMPEKEMEQRYPYYYDYVYYRHGEICAINKDLSKYT